MKILHIIGVGMNGATTAAQSIIDSCDVLMGAPRLLKMYAHLGKPAFAEYTPKGVRRIIEESDAGRFAVLVSGDVGFYSGARALAEDLCEYEVHLTAGVASVCDFFAKLGLSWQDAALVSMHAACGPLVSAVRRSRLTFCLTGGNTEEIGKLLINAGFGGLTVHVGENLGYPDESIYTLKARELEKTLPMAVLAIENPGFVESVPAGLPDSAFLRIEGVPMTKSEVRAVVLSKLRLCANSVCWDVGAGTGSVSIEMALAAYKGRVYAVERSAEAAQLVLENFKKLHIGNIELIEGAAPEVLYKIPAPDVLFIGGSGGRLTEIIDIALDKNPNARIVITAIALETVHTAQAALEHAGVADIEIIQLGVSRAVKRGSLNLLTAQNPIFIISGGGV